MDEFLDIKAEGVNETLLLHCYFNLDGEGLLTTRDFINVSDDIRGGQNV